MKNKTKLETIVLISCLIGILLVSFLYYWLQGTLLHNFATFISGISTVGIFILTAFYVIYTNRQLREIQKQRQLNIQPLPNINIKHGIIQSPRIVIAVPRGGKVSLAIDFKFNAKIKNIGNGAAVLVDTFSVFVGNDVAEHLEKISSRRHMTLEEKEEVDADFSVRDKNFEVVNSLNKAVEGACARSSIFDSMLNYTVIYRNILGAAFIYTVDHVLLINDDSKKKLSNWIGAINSFEKEYSSSIEKFQAIFKRDRDEAFDYLKEIKKDFYTKYEPDSIDVSVRALTKSFKIKHINESTYQSISEKIFHGVPVSAREYKEDEVAEIEEWKNEKMSSTFGEDFGESTKETALTIEDNQE